MALDPGIRLSGDQGLQHISVLAHQSEKTVIIGIPEHRRLTEVDE